MPLNLQAYFDRINYQGPMTVSLETLKNIHRAQALTIPFENLAIHERENENNPNAFIHLDEGHLFQKLVINKRGGYCHENNELLALVLIQLGFKVQRLAARVMTPVPVARGHKILLVTIEGKPWLADVGFGGYGFLEPLPLEVEKEIVQYHHKYRLKKFNDRLMLQTLTTSDWKDLYEFNLEVFEAIDFEPMSYFVSHHPQSFFFNNKICVLPRSEGYIILNNNKLKIETDGQEIKSDIKDGKDYLQVLKQYFNIDLPQGTRFKPLSQKTPAPEIKPTRFSHHFWCKYVKPCTAHQLDRTPIELARSPKPNY
ncbi:MAG: arylamine N-acetyltransferase [Gammaproteobacteria bacterium]|nr:arylamine N-acetyltransferase [Gammaproteobacteria bacterium]